MTAHARHAALGLLRGDLRPAAGDVGSGTIGSGKYDLIVLNYANPDMVGHTGKLAATVKAVRGRRYGTWPARTAVKEADGALLVTADHGNCELMRDPGTGEPHTSHTTIPVPVLLMGGCHARLAEGRLAISPQQRDRVRKAPRK
jgi:2,3-bisphosphoglycerate-independent phosphoglycerate mutase